MLSTVTDRRFPDGEETPEVKLELKELWEKFAAVNTEMVITKSGRSAKQINLFHFMSIFLML